MMFANSFLRKMTTHPTQSMESQEGQVLVAGYKKCWGYPGIHSFLAVDHSKFWGDVLHHLADSLWFIFFLGRAQQKWRSWYTWLFSMGENLVACSTESACKNPQSIPLTTQTRVVRHGACIPWVKANKQNHHISAIENTIHTKANVYILYTNMHSIYLTTWNHNFPLQSPIMNIPLLPSTIFSH